MTSGLPWGLALSSGVNTYLPLFLLALFARFSQLVRLSPRFEWLVSNQAIFILGALAACEILAQKFPILDNLWDMLHTLLRPLAGALAAGATLNTTRAFETLIAMVMGGTLAAASHSAKTSLRLASTTKSLGTANLVVSLGEDAAVVAGTLLSVYAPWVMLGVVIMFILIFAMVGPRMLRALSFDLHIVASWFSWLWAKISRAPAPARLDESLLEFEPEGLRRLSAQLEPGEELLGALTGWKRTGRGPRAARLLITDRRVALVEPRVFRNPRLETISFQDLSVARYRGMGLLAKVDLLTRRSESISLNLRRTHAAFGKMAVQTICLHSGLTRETDHRAFTADPELAPVAKP